MQIQIDSAYDVPSSKEQRAIEALVSKKFDAAKAIYDEVIRNQPERAVQVILQCSMARAPAALMLPYAKAYAEETDAQIKRWASARNAAAEGKSMQDLASECQALQGDSPGSSAPSTPPPPYDEASFAGVAGGGDQNATAGQLRRRHAGKEYVRIPDDY